MPGALMIINPSARLRAFGYPPHVMRAVVRIGGGDSDGANWEFFHGMTAADREAVDTWIVETKHPLGFQAGTQEGRFKELVGEALEATRKPGKRKGNPGAPWRQSGKVSVYELQPEDIPTVIMQLRRGDRFHDNWRRGDPFIWTPEGALLYFIDMNAEGNGYTVNGVDYRGKYQPHSVYMGIPLSEIKRLPRGATPPWRTLPNPGAAWHRKEARELAGLSAWSMFAGGTGAEEGKHGYSLTTDIGNYKIHPFSSKTGRHIGYEVWFENVKGAAAGGLNQPIGSTSHPSTGVGLARKHYQGLRQGNPRFAALIRGRSGADFDNGFATERRTGRAVKVGKETFYVGKAPGDSGFSWSVTDPVSGYAVAVGKNAKDALASLKQRVAKYGGAAGFLKFVKEARREIFGQVARPNPGADTDTGSDPLGDGTFKMFPSGDIVSFDERIRRLDRFHRPKELRPGVFGKSWEQIAEMQGGSETLDITRHKRKKNPGTAADKAYRAFHDRNPDRAVKTKAPASFPRKLWMLGKLHKVTDRSGRVMLTGGILAAGRFGAAPLFILGARAHGAAGRFIAGMTEYIPQRPSKRVGPIYFHEHSGRRPVIVTRAAPGYYKVAGGGLRITRRGIVG